MRVLIVGGGIAGLTLAWWLARERHEVVIAERAPQLRGAGYMIDFFGSGYDVADRMKVLADLGRIHYPVERLTFIAPDGSERVSLEYPLLRTRLFDDRHFNFMRGDLEHVLYGRLNGRVAIRFGTSIEAVSEERQVIRAALSDGSSEIFDLVVGADGIHSSVRTLAFAPESEVTRYLGFHTAAFVIEDPELSAELGNAFQTLTVPGRQVAIYPIREGRVATFFVHADENEHVDTSLDGARRELRQVYGELGWVVPRLLEHLDRAQSVYFDTVSQIVLPKWHRSRVVLVGDSCGCVSLLAGQGASLAMGGAYVLAEELGREKPIEAALHRYEQRMRPLVEKKQLAGRKIARWFVPRTRFSLALRDVAMRASTWPVASWLMRRQLSSESVLNEA
jgi:2-polyprenyl-6-methoxyphenol hydroxylase-like FAD-dependent oxidoreductase